MEEVQRCQKCSSVMEDEGGGSEGLCDNCNMGLIAQNLAAELKNHTVVEEVEAGESDIPIGEVAVVEVVSPSSRDSDSLDVVGEKAKSTVSEDTLHKDDEKTSPTNIDPADEADNTAQDDNNDDENPPEREDDESSDSDSSEGTDVGSPLPSPVGSNASDGDDDDGWRKEKRRRGSTTSEEEDNAEEEEEEDERRLTLEETMVTRRRGVRMAIPAPLTTPVPITAAKALAGEIPPDDLGALDSGTDDDGPVPPRRLTRRAIAEIDKYMHPQYEQQETRSRSRRSKLFKSNKVYKAPTAQARIYHSDYAFHKGRYFQIGDVCATKGLKDPSKTYYCQITSLWTDQYCHKCATIQWLFPTRESPDPNVAFDPRTYFLGFLDETPRPLDCLMPVMNCPPTYFNLDGTISTPNRNIPSYLHIRLRPIYVQDIVPSNPD